MSNRVLILENYRQALAVSRELEFSIWQVVQGVEKSQVTSFNEHSVACADVWEHPDFTHPESFREWLADLLDSAKIGYVFPTGEVSAIVLTEDRSFYERYRGQMIVPQAELIEKCLSKAQSQKWAEELSLSLIPTWEVRSRIEAESIVNSEGFPVVIKSNMSVEAIGEKKAYLIDDQEEWDRIADELKWSSHPWILQKKFSGPRHDLMFIAHRGKLIESVEIVTLRSDEWNGSGFGILAETVEPHPIMHKELERILEHFGYHGLGCIQFLENDDGGFGFLELNPRLDGMTSVATIAGVPLAKMAMDQMIEPEQFENYTPKFNYKKRLKVSWSTGDVRSCLTRFKDKEISFGQAMSWLVHALLWRLRADADMVWSWSDRGPALQESKGILKSILKVFR